MYSTPSATTTANMTLKVHSVTYQTVWEPEPPVYPWMTDYLNVVGEMELLCYPVEGDPADEFRHTLRRLRERGWCDTAVLFYSPHERREISKYLKRLGDDVHISRPYRCDDRMAIVCDTNEPELAILFKREVDREEFLEWTKGRFARPTIFFTQDEPSKEAKAALKGLNHLIIHGSKGYLISTEVMPDDRMEMIQRLLQR